MKTITDLIKADDPAQSIGLETPQTAESKNDRLKQEKVWDRLWLRLAEIYGSSLVSQYGETIPESWELLLTDVTPLQIKDGLNALATRDSSFPPNAAEFRQLCLPKTISPDGVNSSAYLSFDDPKHPSYEPPKQLESDSYKERKRKAGNNALSNLKDLL